MAIRQEQIVLIGVSLLLGYLVFTNDSSSSSGGRRKPKAPAFEDHFAPDVERAQAQARDLSALNRELFSAPTDTRPFPQLVFETPLLEPLQSLRPPPVAGPDARLFGSYLRSHVKTHELQGLFLPPELGEQTAASDEFALDAESDVSALTAEERQALIAGYKVKYDWIHLGSERFGYIRNANRFALNKNLQEKILFVEVNPMTGKEIELTRGGIEIERERILNYGFADTVENRIEQERMQFDDELTQGQFLPAMEFAHRAFVRRFESPRALEVAEEMYGRAGQLTVDDPGAQLGLAACAQSRYEFEAAFGIYQSLIQGRFSKHPEVLGHLAELEARFRMTEQARVHFTEAQSYDRTSWFVQWRYGRFLLDLGDSAAAQEHLRVAVEFEPKASDYQVLRGLIRTDFAESLVGTGAMDEARAMFSSALLADESSQRAHAGVLGLAYLKGGDQAPNGDTLDGQTAGAGFELLMAQGLNAMGDEDYPVAMERLQLAATADPLRAYIPWRALSYLAELTSNASEALSFADQAQANNPTDVYSLFQRGRILAQNGDSDGALDSLKKALDLELELPDALAIIGRLEMEAGDHEDAERFLERATQVDAKLTSAFTTRGLNSLHLGRPAAARLHFDEALVQNPADPVAAIGQAWCVYSLGDSTEAKTLLREFEDSRRHLGEEDIYRVYANEQIARIGDWEEKVVWSDHFERTDIRNGWLFDEVPAVLISAREGKVVMEGTYDKSGVVRLKRNYTSGDFVSLEARVTIRAGSNVRAGIFVGMEQRRGSRRTNAIETAVTVSRHGIEKRAQYRSVRRNNETDYTDVDVMTWADDQAVLLKLERYGDSGQTAFRVFIDGVLVSDRVSAPALGQNTREIVVGIYTEGEPGRKVSLEIDDVEIVKRQR